MQLELPRMLSNDVARPVGWYAVEAKPNADQKHQFAVLKNILFNAKLPRHRTLLEYCIWLSMKASTTDMPSPGRTLIINWIQCLGSQGFKRDEILTALREARERTEFGSKLTNDLLVWEVEVAKVNVPEGWKPDQQALFRRNEALAAVRQKNQNKENSQKSLSKQKDEKSTPEQLSHSNRKRNADTFGPLARANPILLRPLKDIPSPTQDGKPPPSDPGAKPSLSYFCKYCQVSGIKLSCTKKLSRPRGSHL